MTITAPYAEIAPTLAALKALTASQRCPNYCLFIPSLGSWVSYSPTSTATANDTTIIEPTDGLGRWIVTNQSAAPSSGSGGGSGITRQPAIELAQATLADLQRATNQILSTLTAAGITGAIIYTRNYDAANPTNDLINLLGTNNNTVAYANPHTTAKIINSASSTGAGTVAALTDRLDGDFYTNSVSNSWVQIDLASSRTVKLTGLGVRNRPDGASSPVSLVIEGSNDGASFLTINNWNSIQFTGALQWRYTVFTESPSYRYVRIRQPGLNSTSSNFLGITEINLYGTVSAL